MAGKRRGHGDGSITWDESVQLWVGRLPRDERGRRAKVSGKTRAEAQRNLRKKLQERDQGLAATAGRTTVRAYLEGWLRDTVMPSALAESTKQKHEIAIRLHLVPGLGRIKLAGLTPAQLQRWLREELAAGKGPRTLQIAHSTLRSALEQAVLWGLIPRNVARLVRAPAYSAPEKRPFTVAEQVAILRAARGDRLYVLVVLAQATGLRQSELLGVRWSAIDLDGGRLRMRKQLGRDGRLKDPKSEAGKRLLPLPSKVVKVLREHQGAQARERAEAVWWEDHDLVTCTRTGRPVGQRNAHRSWTRIVASADVEHRGVHHMRHAFVTMLAERGVHERVAQQLAGHADSRITREVYTHVTEKMMEGAAEAIEQAMEALPDPDDEAMGPAMGPEAGRPGRGEATEET